MRFRFRCKITANGNRLQIDFFEFERFHAYAVNKRPHERHLQILTNDSAKRTVSTVDVCPPGDAVCFFARKSRLTDQNYGFTQNIWLLKNNIAWQIEKNNAQKRR